VDTLAGDVTGEAIPAEDIPEVEEAPVAVVADHRVTPMEKRSCSG
jgi:hypothetical protein